VLIAVITLLPLPSTERVLGLDIRHVFVNFSHLLIYTRGLWISSSFSSILQRRIRNEASNDWRVRQHPATTADRISLRRLADDRNTGGHTSLWSATATAACGGRVFVWQHSDSAAPGRRVVWKYTAACTVSRWIVWKYHDPAAARSRRFSIWGHHNPTNPGWRTLRCPTTGSTTAGGFTFWQHTTTCSAAGRISLWEHSATRHRADFIVVWDDTAAASHRDFIFRWHPAATDRILTIRKYPTLVYNPATTTTICFGNDVRCEASDFSADSN
jgi:hypothetical protein